MTSSVEPAMFANFLDFVIDGKKPALTEGTLPTGVKWTWLGDGIVRFEPQGAEGEVLQSVVASAGIHGDETAPIEILSMLVADIASGKAALKSRLLIIFGNIDAMRASCRYRDDDLNRLFNGRYLELAASHESPRAAELENVTRAFFKDVSHAKWHIDMHTAIRPSVFEQFALLPYTGAPLSRVMFDWLKDAGLSAVLLHREKSNTFTHFTAEQSGALACTLELGKVRPFGHNDLTRFAASDAALRRLIAGVAPLAPSSDTLKVFTVVGQIDKQSEQFKLHVAGDVANFTPFTRGTVLAEDGDYRYEVMRDEERIVFPNPTVKPGLRAGLMVIDTTSETFESL
ncbi:succinylglutamate desuccinylase [Caballeronia sp. SEWSISQ10-4 2]|uniref:succinylglutamate desuccinylase n=1 Tax=Caballeronia sp. SEWSISQ10-4 2 TaxID=2937438 RepID=UPI00264AF03B|nr:succinylglutamate desuccinylase [Caballeronia sp. SEWSISQ10-4 2]MDN7180166.1 succinylglutamate desuccinylase [Caballeronia sp. SEWSISQ10-4 2]